MKLETPTGLTMQVTKTEQSQIDRQPFQLDDLVVFCDTKKLGKQLACDLGESLQYADRARNQGESDDTEFESMFWNGLHFFSTDELYDMNIAADDLPAYSSAAAYDEALDATFYLCRYGRRRFIAVRYEFKEDEYAVSAWWLTRDDHLGR